MIIQRADGSERKISGYKYAAPKPDTKRFATEEARVQDLPPRVDLRAQMTEVEDQGPLSSCVANAVAGAYEYLVKRHRGDDAYNVSRLFIYYNARALDNPEAVQDEGSIVAKALESLQQYGACSEATWPYQEDLVNERPNDDAYNEASQFLVEDMSLVPTDLRSWKQCLAEGSPIVFGISLFKSFDSHRKKGLVPMPTASESSRESHGGHAMLAVGYSDKDKLFVVRNSWGNGWGDQGYCYIPYDYLMNENYNSGDSWIIRRLEALPVDEEAWGDDTSIVPELETELANMPEEQFQEMLDALGEHPLEYRIALLLLSAAGADGEVSEEEAGEIAGYLQSKLEQLGVEMSAEKILKHCARDLGDEALLNDSVALLGQYLSKPMLAGLANDIAQIAGVDDLSEEEESFVYQLVQAWQVEENG